MFRYKIIFIRSNQNLGLCIESYENNVKKYMVSFVFINVFRRNHFEMIYTFKKTIIILYNISQNLLNIN